MTGRVVRQHVVSKFYLRGFANESGLIARVELPGDDVLRLSISDATVIKDFYTITLPDGSKSDAFEQAFGELEGLAAPALAEILNGTWPVDGEHREALSGWAALQHLRSEDIRASQTEMNAESIRLIVGVSGKALLRNLIERSESRVVDDDELDWEWNDLTKPGGPDMVGDPEAHIRLLLSMLDGTGRYLHDCHWTLYRFVRRVLVTSDHPVAMLAAPDASPWDGVGVLTAAAFLVPLSRHTALMIQPHERMPGGDSVLPDVVGPASTALARSMNATTARHARKHVYHHPDDSPLDGLSLPQPESRRWTASGVAGLINEKGLFHDLDDNQLKSMSRASPSGDDARGISIADLEWPIPGRKARPPH